MIKLLFLILLLAACAPVPKEERPSPLPPPSIDACKINPTLNCDNPDQQAATGRGVSQ